MGKTAQELSGFGYPTGGSDKDIGVYRQPQKNPNGDMDVYTHGNTMDDLNISLGNLTKGYKSDNPYGVKEMKGFGAATKGKKISGKQG